MDPATVRNDRDKGEKLLSGLAVMPDRVVGGIPNKSRQGWAPRLSEVYANHLLYYAPPSSILHQAVFGTKPHGASAKAGELFELWRHPLSGFLSSLPWLPSVPSNGFFEVHKPNDGRAVILSWICA
jgi:hypothetical protein